MSYFERQRIGNASNSAQWSTIQMESHGDIT